VLSNKLSERFAVPAPAIFLLAAALAGRSFSRLGDELSIRDVERIAVVALVAILFDGGMRVGWQRFRASLVPIASLGVVGTFATAGLMALAARYLFGFSWTSAGILGAALAPTDPAVMFSLLGKREIGGRTGTILEGESGVNDPVGIALMIGMLGARHACRCDLLGRRPRVRGRDVGRTRDCVAGAFLVIQAIRRVDHAEPGPLSAPHARRRRRHLRRRRNRARLGIPRGLRRRNHHRLRRPPEKRNVERFHTSLASLAEIVVFVALGLTVNKSRPRRYLGLARRAPARGSTRLRRPAARGRADCCGRLGYCREERLFVMWSGLKGAVPILLAAFALLERVDGAERIYGIVFVLVTFSVFVQGATVPFVAGRLGIPMSSEGGSL